VGLSYYFPELDEITRRYMLNEFETEEASGQAYRSLLLTLQGQRAYPDVMRYVIEAGDEESLALLLSRPAYWLPEEPMKDGSRRKVNVGQASKRLARLEFNTWYVRGLSLRLLDEGHKTGEVYEAAGRSWPLPNDCARHYGVVSLRDVRDGHRATYWPTRPYKVSIPSGPLCVHSIRKRTHLGL